jgi:hypothetical protein
MFKKLGLVGLSLLAVMAVGAMAASAASAAVEVHAGEYPAIVTGTQEGVNTFGNGVRTVTCSDTESSLTGELTAASEQLTVHPIYAGCTGNSSTFAKVTTTYSPETETEKKALWHLTWTETISPGVFKLHIKLTGTIVIHIWSNKKESEEGKPTLCTLEIPGEQVVTGVTGRNEGTGTGRSVKLEINSSNIIEKRVSGTTANCGKEEVTTGTYTGTVRGTATKNGNPVGLWIE